MLEVALIYALIGNPARTWCNTILSTSSPSILFFSNIFFSRNTYSVGVSSGLSRRLWNCLWKCDLLKINNSQKINYAYRHTRAWERLFKRGKRKWHYYIRRQSTKWSTIATKFHFNRWFNILIIIVLITEWLCMCYIHHKLISHEWDIPW